MTFPSINKNPNSSSRTKLLLSPTALLRLSNEATDDQISAAIAPLNRFLETATPDAIKGQPDSLIDALAKAYINIQSEEMARPLYRLLPRFLRYKPYRRSMMDLVAETLAWREEDFTCADSFIRRVKAMKLTTLCADALNCAYEKKEGVETAVNESILETVKKGLCDPHWAVRHAGAETAEKFVSMRPRRSDEETFTLLLDETTKDTIFNDIEGHVLAALQANIAAREDVLQPRDLQALECANLSTPCPLTSVQLREIVGLFDAHAPHLREKPLLQGKVFGPLIRRLHPRQG